MSYSKVQSVGINWHVEPLLECDAPLVAVRKIDSDQRYSAQLSRSSAVEELDLAGLGFEGVHAEETGRPAYHPATLLRIYIYGYMNRVQSSRRLERETQRNLELIWLTGRLSPDFKTIADFRRDNGPAIRRVCAQFITLCRQLKLFAEAVVSIDGSKFKAVNNTDRNFSERKLKARTQRGPLFGRAGSC